MTLTIWLMALGSGLIGVLPTYAEIGIAAPILLVLARVIQGFSTGGEMGPATAFLLESAPPRRESEIVGDVVRAGVGQFAAAEIAASPALRGVDFREIGRGVGSVGATSPCAHAEEFRANNAVVRSALSFQRVH